MGPDTFAREIFALLRFYAAQIIVTDVSGLPLGPIFKGIRRMTGTLGVQVYRGWCEQ
jgi:hypothetical protein